ncbi:sulfatase-like hydrolase/transferase [Nitratireductor sp. XY-223]|uniref:sulfatase family protein n=1 Tax=Nitratireductor sp. XY-223 TaxID=2561926 RepID=UPI0010AA5C28|nr:sulfatase-like hydrolase/transferase [Nitratireductor sp. XY-223]
MTKRPSFIFFMTDQHRADWLGCYGHPVVRTPHIDSLAAGGTRFENFHVASQVCMPNRGSFMTGRYPSQHGLRYNGCVLPERANTFVDVLAAGGYHTAAIGKSHLQPFMEPRPGVHEPDPGPSDEAWKRDESDYLQEQPGRYLSDGRYEFRTPYYGYRHVDMVTLHGDRCGGHYQQWFRSRASDWRSLQDDRNQLPHNYSCPQAYRTPVPEELYPTAYIRDRAVDYLESRKGSDAPFFLFVSFPDPHHPFNPPGRYWDMYTPDAFEVALPYEAHVNPPPPMRYLHERWQSRGRQATPQEAMMLDTDHLREAMALTAGMVSMVDDAVGAVMDGLRASGHFDNTVVCFNADHGDYLGDFNMLFKGAMPFRAVTRVPFIWSDPARNTVARSDALGSTVDLSATILERAGLSPYFGMQGRSLLPCLDGEGRRRELLMEYNDAGIRLGFEAPARVRTLLTDRHRFTLYRDQAWGELYDLQEDPNETNNRWDDPAYAAVKAELSLRLNHHLTGLMDESPRGQHPA